MADASHPWSHKDSPMISEKCTCVPSLERSDPYRWHCYSIDSPCKYSDSRVISARRALRKLCQRLQALFHFQWVFIIFRLAQRYLSYECYLLCHTEGQQCSVVCWNFDFCRRTSTLTRLRDHSSLVWYFHSLGSILVLVFFSHGT